jgi:hypothetical protein
MKYYNYLKLRRKIYIPSFSGKNMGLEEETKRWEGLKEKAIASWNGVDYVKACNNLGLEPEFTDLYESGLAERINLRKKISSFKKTKQRQNYLNFYEEGAALTRFSSTVATEEKMRLLQKYFLRFSDSGKQPIAEYNNFQIGRVYQKMIVQAEKELGIANRQ